MTNEIDWVAEINDMRTNETRIQKSGHYAKARKNITGHFIMPHDDEGKIACPCGIRVPEKWLKKHLRSIEHNGWVRGFLEQRLGSPPRYTGYTCTHGMYAGYRLEDVIRADPCYIDFLIRDHAHTFQPEFTRALQDCGLRW